MALSTFFIYLLAFCVFRGYNLTQTCNVSPFYCKYSLKGTEIMQKFIGNDFLLTTETARRLYRDYAEKLPIIDYHCHISPREIAEDVRFENITQLWLGGDHYKWRLMRSAGVEEKYITGDASDYEKFIKWASVLEKAVGNPLLHWSHLELKRYFGYDGVLTSKTADSVWNLCLERLAQPDMSARGIIRKSNVETICTTDDPSDSLEWHRQIAADKSFKTKVLPAWRPDRAMNVEKPDFSNYISTLSEVSGIGIKSFADLKAALSKRMDFFAENGCTLADNAPEYVMFSTADNSETERIFIDALNGKAPSPSDILKYKTAFMLFCGEEYARRGWTMQLHYGCSRNNNTSMFGKIGADTGFDAISSVTPSEPLIKFLDTLESEALLPKTIIYSLNPNDNQMIDTIIGCFQNSEAVGKIQHGSAWWFNDCIDGMRAHLKSLGNRGYLAGFVGMLTDSRSFLSYTRHEYFRRILCGLLGEWTESGMIPDNIETLGGIVSDISYYNAKKYFGF